MVMDCWKHFHLSILEIHYRKTEKFINIQHSGMMFGVCAGSGFIFIFEFVFLNRHFLSHRKLQHKNISAIKCSLAISYISNLTS